jgi:hypothetical protein
MWSRENLAPLAVRLDQVDLTVRHRGLPDLGTACGRWWLCRDPREGSTAGRGDIAAGFRVGSRIVGGCGSIPALAAGLGGATMSGPVLHPGRHRAHDERRAAEAPIVGQGRHLRRPARHRTPWTAGRSSPAAAIAAAAMLAAVTAVVVTGQQDPATRTRGVEGGTEMATESAAPSGPGLPSAGRLLPVRPSATGLGYQAERSRTGREQVKDHPRPGQQTSKPRPRPSPPPRQRPSPPGPAATP